MKKILITGCGSDLGLEASFALANRGHYVYATTHTKRKEDKHPHKRYISPPSQGTFIKIKNIFIEVIIKD
nr:hypothetical protein [Clostridium sp.]